MAAEPWEQQERQRENKMSNKNTPAKRDNARIARLIFVGPVGNWAYAQLTKSDYDRQVAAIQKLKDNGMEHGHVKLISKRKAEIRIKHVNAKYRQQHDGEYSW